MKYGLLTIGIILVALLTILGWQQLGRETTTEPNVSSSETDEVKQVVTEFGSQLQMVSLLAPAAERRAAMEEHYAPYVAPELLASWYPEGADAIGRYTSSPWPERIDIVETHAEAGGRYVVEGNVIEVTSVEAGGEEAAAVYPVTLTLEERDGAWLITDLEKGAYSELPRRQSIVGYWECLPHKNASGPQTLECALGIAVDQSDGHFAVDTQLMAQYPVDFPTGTKVRVTGVVTPVTHLSSEQKYDIDGIISATEITEVD